MKTTIKPCPFCGHKHSRVERDECDWYWRICQGCRGSAGPWRTAKEANEAWQARKRKPCRTA